jgi:hypothetical protein
MREMRNEFIIFAGSYEGKRPFWTPWHTMEDNIKVNLKRNRV